MRADAGGDQQAILGAEVVEHRALADPGRLGGVADRRGAPVAVGSSR
jgi:hypothetical protein